MPEFERFGERMAALEARFESFEKYSHDRWHDLNNSLQPIMMLPERITRDIAKIQGTLESRVNEVGRGIDATVLIAVKDALSPVSQELMELKAKVSVLELANAKEDAQKSLMVSFFKSPVVIWAAGLLFAAYSILKGEGRLP